MLCMTRRSFLTVSTLGWVGALLSACSGTASPTPTNPPVQAAAPTSAPSSSTAAQPTSAPAQPASVPTAAPTVTAVATAPASTSGKTVIKLMHFYPNNLMENLNRRLALFNQESTQYQAESVQTPGGGSYRDKLVTMFAGGIPPEAFLISQAPASGYAFGVLAYRGQLVDMGPLVTRDKYDINDYFKVIVDYDTYKGKLMALPNDINVYAMFLNVNLLKQSGGALPSETWGDSSWNWDALVNFATKLTKRSGDRTSQFGFAVTPASTEWLRPWLWNNGGSDLNEDWTKATINTPQAIEALGFLQDLIYKYKVSPTPSEQKTLPQADEFFTGRLASMYAGASFVNQCRTSVKNFEWDSCPGPVGKVAHVTACGGASWAMAAGAKNQAGAWELCKSLSGPKSQAIGAEYGQMPSRLSVDNSPSYLDPSKPPKHLSVFIDAAKNARSGYLVTNWAQIEDAMNKELDYLWLNQRKPAEVAANLEKAINELLAQSTKMT